MKDTETKNRLAEAYGEVLDREIAEASARGAEDPHVFSESFEKRMDKLIRTGKLRRARPRKALGIVIAAASFIVLLALIACAVPVVRNAFAGFIVGRSPDCSDVQVRGETKKLIEEEYELTLIPEGFEERKKSASDILIKRFYLNAEGDDIMLQQSADNSVHTITDRAELTELDINGMKVLLARGDRCIIAVWLQDGYSFFLGYYNAPDNALIDLEYFKAMVGSVRIAGE